MHPVQLDPAYMKQILRHAKYYHVDSFEICGECHNPYGGLDGLITYSNFPDISSKLDHVRIEENQRNLNAIIDMAHQSDRPVYYWHREIMIPPGLTDAIPELLDENHEFNLLGDAFTKLIIWKINTALAVVPALDGLVLTLTEADYSVIHNSNPNRYPPAEVVSHIVGTFCKALGSHNKRLILRSFGSIAQDYEDILSGAAKVAENCSFEIETKITPYDFVPFLPPNPFLRKIPGTTMGAECDCLGEFLGAGYLPAANVERIVAYVREGQEKGADRFALRLDRIANNIFDSGYEINLYAYHRAIADPSVTAETIWKEWAEQNNWPDEMTAITRQGIRAVEKINFIDGNVMFHMFPLDPDWKWIKAGGIASLFKENVPLQWQSGIWSILSGNTTPATRSLIVQEKDEAIQLIDEQLAQFPAEGFDAARREWTTAREVAQIYRAFCRCVCAYFQCLENEEETPTELFQTLENEKPLFTRFLSEEELAATTCVNPQGEAIDHHAMSPRDNPLKNVYAKPMWAIINQLTIEYAAELKSRKRADGAIDQICFGALTDEWRIRRYMHASHSAIHNGRPSRVIANRVFPNGYLEFELQTGSKLIMEVDPSSAEAMKITINGQSKIVDIGNGTIEIPTSECDAALIRLEKSGADYPRVYSLVST